MGRRDVILRPTRMAQNYYGLKTKNQISSFLTMGNLNIYTLILLHAQIQNRLSDLLSAYAFFATKYQIAARNYSECNNHHVILRH